MPEPTPKPATPIFPRLLALVSPRMKDGDVEGHDDVSRAQRMLFRNRLGMKDPEDGGGEFYHADEPQHRDDDGVFGSFTGKAASKARYFLGYPKRGPEGWARRRFDQRLARYLSGEKTLPRRFRIRRRRRLKRAQESLGAKALKAAMTHYGETEHPPGSNRTQTTEYWGFVGAWCLMFASRCYIEAGSKLFRRGSLYAYNPTLYHAVKAGRDGMEFVPLSKARPGDLVQFDWNDGTEPPDHVALFEKRVGNDVQTIDGNWDSRVGRQSHPASAVMDVIRVWE